MLVLSRKVGQEIVLPSYGVTLTVIRVSGNRVRLGVTAPAKMPVHRTETLARTATSGERARRS